MMDQQGYDIFLEKAYYMHIHNYFYYMQLVVHMDMMATVLQGGVAEPSLFNSTYESNGSVLNAESNKGMLVGLGITWDGWGMVLCGVKNGFYEFL